jgi:hypothetical protein
MSVLIAGGLLLAACGSADRGGPAADDGGREPSLPAETVAEGVNGPRLTGEVVARSEQEWQAAWERHEGPAPAPAGVDFTTTMVVAVFQGEKPSAGYSVRITGADRRPQGLEVRYLSVAPGPDCMTASVITAPFHVVAVERVDGEVHFSAREHTEPCGP